MYSSVNTLGSRCLYGEGFSVAMKVAVAAEGVC